MTAAPATPDALWYARAALTEDALHCDGDRLEACATIEALSPCPHEISRARALRVLVEGETE